MGFVSAVGTFDVSLTHMTRTFVKLKASKRLQRVLKTQAKNTCHKPALQIAVTSQHKDSVLTVTGFKTRLVTVTGFFYKGAK